MKLTVGLMYDGRKYVRITVPKGRKYNHNAS